MNKEELFDALKDKDTEKVQKDLKLIFDEKLEKKIWKIYEGIEAELKEKLEMFRDE